MEDEHQEAKNFEQKADEFFVEKGEGTPAESSPENKPEDQTPDTEKPAGAEPDKTEQVKTVEEDSTLSVDEKIVKVKEILGDDEKAVDAYIKEKGYHNDPAWQKQREIIDKLRKESESKAAMFEEDRVALEEFKKFRSSPDYIKSSMKAQGYTQEKIDEKLQEAGLNVDVNPQDDVQLVVSKLGIDLDKLPAKERQSIVENIEDFSKVANIIFEDRMSKVLPKELAPVKDHLQTIEKSESASKLTTDMRSIVTKDKVLDFDKDIDPVLNKYLDDNPTATQQEVFEHFKQINHDLTIERLRIGNKQEERDGKKENLRQNIPLTKSAGGKLPDKTGNFEEDSDAFFDTVNV